MLESGTPRRLQSGTGVPSAGVPKSPFCKSSGQRVLYSVCGFAVALFLVLGAVSFNIQGQRSGKGDQASFCCLREANELSQYVNITTNPCKNFFAYVCSNVVSEKPSSSDDQDFQIAYSLITGTRLDGKPKGDAGRFLTSYFRSCVEAVPRPESFLDSLANALLRHEWANSRHTDSREVIKYMLTASVKYAMPSVIAIFLSRHESVGLEVSAICDVGDSSNAVTATVNAVNKHLNVTLKTTDVTSFAARVCRMLAALDDTTRTYTMLNDSRSFNEEVWPVNAFQAAIGDYKLQNTTNVEVESVQQVRRLHDELTGRDDRSGDTATKIAYLVWHSVVHGSSVFYDPYDGHYQSAFSACMGSLFLISALWQAFASEMFRNPRAYGEARAVFDSVKRAVHADCQTSKIFDADDLGRLRSFVDNLDLVAPADTSQFSSLMVPNGTDGDIGENLLRGRVYSYEISSIRTVGVDDADVAEYGPLRFVGDMQLLMPVSVYKYVGIGNKTKDIPNYAHLGRLFAESLWYKLLSRITWSAKTSSNIDKVMDCLEGRIGGGDVRADVLAVQVLGLRSALRAVNKPPEWNVPYVTTTLWRVTEAQLFFIISTYKRCPTRGSRRSARLVNMVTSYVNEFSAAFHCRNKGTAVQFDECFPH